MDIPDDVIQAANYAANFRIDNTPIGFNPNPAYAVIARWARRQALIEAAEAVEENPGGREVHVGVISALRQGVYVKPGGK